MSEETVEFDDGTDATCDVVVACTGFAISFPFLEDHHPEIALRARNARSLFKHMLIPHLGTSIVFTGIAGIIIYHYTMGIYGAQCNYYCIMCILA